MEGVDLFRVLPNKTLEDIARERPRDKAGLTGIKGIKEAKFRKYGNAIMKIVNENGDGPESADKIDRKDNLLYFRRKAAEKTGSGDQEKNEAPSEKIYSVGEFWDAVNGRLCSMRVRIRGEVSSVDIRNTAVYFNIKDKKDESVMNCFIFRYQYDILAVDLTEGMEVLVHGYPEVYKPSGRISLKTDVIEPEGEGALKKEYELLKKKLEDEGIFAAMNKKEMVALPRTIGLLTSRDGAAIGDFRSNIGRYGFRIKFINSNVEGKRAVFELIGAIRTFGKMEGLDALVIIRGGGSLESLQAFNNEALIREAKALDIPVICGVGHDKDISLLSLAADYSVSTPTAAARLIGGLWEREIGRMDLYERNILDGFVSRLQEAGRLVRDASTNVNTGVLEILRGTERRFENFAHKALGSVEEGMAEARRNLESYREDLDDGLRMAIERTKDEIERAEHTLKLNDPERQLKLGYGIISKDGACVRSVADIGAGDLVKIRMRDGEAKSQIKTIKKFKE